MACGQDNNSRIIPQKTIYETIKDLHVTSLKTFKLKGKIKTVIEKYKDINIKDTLIDFSKYEVTNSDITKEPWFLGSFSKKHELNFNKNGNLDHSTHVHLDESKTTTKQCNYDKNNNLISENETTIEYDEFYPEGRTWKIQSEYIYNDKGHLIKCLWNGHFVFSYKYFPDKLQVEHKYISPKNDSLVSELITYDKYGLKLSSQEYDHKHQKGDLWEYQYDQLGKTIQEKVTYQNGRSHVYKQRKPDTSVKVYRLYDEKNNCIERIIQDKNGRLAIRTLTIEYY